MQQTFCRIKVAEFEILCIYETREEIAKLAEKSFLIYKEIKLE